MRALFDVMLAVGGGQWVVGWGAPRDMTPAA
jgi:hypothetical protein